MPDSTLYHVLRNRTSKLLGLFIKVVCSLDASLSNASKELNVATHEILGQKFSIDHVHQFLDCCYFVYNKI